MVDENGVGDSDEEFQVVSLIVSHYVFDILPERGEQYNSRKRERPNFSFVQQDSTLYLVDENGGVGVRSENEVLVSILLHSMYVFDSLKLQRKTPPTWLMKMERRRRGGR